MNILYFDPVGGAAGDMIVGALLDLRVPGLDLEWLRGAMAPLGDLGGYRLELDRVTRHAVSCAKFRVIVEGAEEPEAAAESAEGRHVVRGRGGPTRVGASEDRHEHGHTHEAERSAGVAPRSAGRRATAGSRPTGARTGRPAATSRHGQPSNGSAGDGHAHEHPHVHRPYRDIRSLLQGSGLDPVAKDIALAVFAALAEAEGFVHRADPEEIEFHEVGSVDSIADIVGAALCLARLGGPRCCAGALPVSPGTVRSQHGVLPLPAPATAYLLTGLPIVPAPGRVERVTPTAAAVLRTVVGEWTTFPPPDLAPARTVRIGYGAGDRDDQDLPDYLRVMELEGAGTASRRP